MNKFIFIVSFSFILFCNFVFSAQEKNSYEACGNNQQARHLAKLIIEDVNQQRPNIRCNDILKHAALNKAKLMLERGLVAHNLGGSPNNWLREAGYQLPEYYGSSFSNQVEAIAGGYEDAKAVWFAFKNSDSHRSHLLAEIDFYREQDELGVAFISKWQSPHVEYWVVYLTKGYKPNQQPRFIDIPNKTNLIMIKD